MKRKLKTHLGQNHLGALARRCREDWSFHARVALYVGAVLNLLYALFKLLTGLFYHSSWLIAIAAYYAILILMRLSLVRQDIRGLRRSGAPDILAEWRSYRRTGWLMLLMNLGLSGILVQVIVQNRSYTYPGAIIFFMAAYTFYRVGAAILRVGRGRKVNAPVLHAARAIDLSFAVTSVFTLQTAMLASFSPEYNARILNLITGTAAALVISAIAVTLILRGTRNLEALLPSTPLAGQEGKK